ncbi:MAG: hypothetical protein OES20_11945 [Gammaproteobacteria bacterium]|nr:hypothetical protein [Gammaproteobacteria bacterium]MDH3859238.1 hypothetical protein [Gammaproteobacteria bacterium]
MHRKKYPAMKDRRDIGRVDIAIEKLMAAREVSSCCVGVEALLEIDSKLIDKHLKTGSKFPAV